MRFRIITPIFLALIALYPGSRAAGGRESGGFSKQWRFLRNDVPQAMNPEFDDRGWETVTLPHPAHLEPLVTGASAPQWQGVCWYRKTFPLPASAQGKEISLRFEGAMNSAGIWINGVSAGHFMGGYLPYVMNITALAHPGRDNVIAVRLDNRDNPITGPKPLATLDFNLYGGLYREVHLMIQDPLHITDSILANTVAGGGVFVTYPSVSGREATVRIQTQVTNAEAVARVCSVKSIIFDEAGRETGAALSDPLPVPACAAREITQEIRLEHPRLWSPRTPSLYNLRSELLEGGETIETQTTRIGIRKIQIDKDGLRINGEKFTLRGVNRHQEYPYIGNALPAAAQYRDARKIKEAGFDFVRLSHYPQSPAFLDACDELGLVVMDSIMGWQYFNNDPAFADLKLQECRQLVRRDRNHPSVVVWEVSLNETRMPESFVQRAHAIAHEEYPGDQCYTCGWQDGYDVFIQARQHGGCRSITNRPCLISEYGDWEYYAQNAGFAQNQWKDLKPADRSSRQLRGDGEVRLLQQALNFQEAHNDNLKTKAFADCVWVMFDYNRGYADDVESSGVMDLFRLPKFGYWFFRSQRGAEEMIAGQPLGPVLFIANYWTKHSPLEARVFSNCEEVALYLNDQLVGRRRPDVSRVTTHLAHAPFTFKLAQFQPGTLRAAGYIGGREVASVERRTPGEPDAVALRFDLSGRAFGKNRDTAFCYADVRDKSGTVVPASSIPIFFGSTGETHLIGANPIMAEAGTATILADTTTANPACAVYAICLLQGDNQTRVLSAAASPDGSAPPGFAIRYTTDGTEPAPDSPLYAGPVANAPRLRAAVFVGGQSLACADLRSRAASTGDTVKQTAALKEVSSE